MRSTYLNPHVLGEFLGEAVRSGTRVDLWLGSIRQATAPDALSIPMDGVVARLSVEELTVQLALGCPHQGSAPIIDLTDGDLVALVEHCAGWRVTEGASPVDARSTHFERIACCESELNTVVDVVHCIPGQSGARGLVEQLDRCDQEAIFVHSFLLFLFCRGRHVRARTHGPRQKIGW